MRAFEVLVVDDDPVMRESLEHLLTSAGFVVRLAESAAAARAAIETVVPEVVLTDVRMPRESGLDLLTGLVPDGPPVVLMSAHGDIPMAVEAMQAGAYSFVEKPFQPQRLVTILTHAGQARRLSAANARLSARLRALSGLDRVILGAAPAMAALRGQVLDVVDAPAPVMLTGETGTGKELAARALHDLGPRRAGPFLALNCAALPPDRVEEQLFGREEEGRVLVQGHFRAAAGGTLFLDEIGAMALGVQTKLLRALEGGGILPLGRSTPVPVELRIVAATNEDLAEAIAAGGFRQDLFFRLSALPIRLPALREHGDDIPLLFAHFLAQHAAIYEITPPEVTPEDVAALLSHHWPGNVRELRHVAERRVLAARRGAGSVAQAMQLSDEAEIPPGTLREAVAVVERQMIARAIRAHDGRMDAVAEALGIGRRTLNEKMVKLGIDREAIL